MKKINAGTFAMLGLLVSGAFVSQAFAYTQIQTELDLGEKNYDVTSLQTFFADNTAIYPEGLITGYFGGLTKASVMRFQAQYGLDQVGRVGPMTKTKINDLIVSGGWTMVDASGPAIFSVAQTVSSNSMTFNWATNELATAKVFYNTSPITMNEGDINSLGFGSTNGFTGGNDGIARTSQQVTVMGLQPNTTYYYVIVSTDLKGNVSVWNPNMTLRTNQ
jgi:peptidoglycan hydrolase-like protein with peptidoglycan-binding domain